MNEEWIDIKGFEGKYQVSNLGQVRSLTHKTKFTGKGGSNSIRTHKGRVLKPVMFGLYHGVCLSFSRDIIARKYIHKLVAEHFIPNPFNKKEANHIDLNKSNNRVDNLEWVTSKENMLHARINGAIPHVTLSKINPSDVMRLFNDKSSIGEISRRTGFTYNTIYRLKTGRTWSHLTNAKT